MSLILNLFGYKKKTIILHLHSWVPRNMWACLYLITLTTSPWQRVCPPGVPFLCPSLCAGGILTKSSLPGGRGSSSAKQPCRVVQTLFRSFHIQVTSACISSHMGSCRDHTLKMRQSFCCILWAQITWTWQTLSLPCETKCTETLVQHILESSKRRVKKKIHKKKQAFKNLNKQSDRSWLKLSSPASDPRHFLPSFSFE